MLKNIEDKRLKNTENKQETDMHYGETVGNFWISDRRLWHNHNKTMLVEEGDERAATLYCHRGSKVPMEMAVKHKLVTVKQEPTKKVMKKKTGGSMPASGKTETKQGD